MTPPQNPVAQPLGGATVSGTTITVDTYVNPPARIPAIIRSLVSDQQGYFAEQVLGTLGAPVNGGAVIVEETFPEDFFLPGGEGPTPRAPGAEAPRLGSTRHEPKVKRPESWSGSIEVTDEARQRNMVISVQRQFTQAANSFADILNRRAIQVLIEAVEGWERKLESKVNWHEAHSEGMVNVDPLKLPAYDIGRVLKQFFDDKVGVAPDTAIMHTTEGLYLDMLYPGNPMVPTVDSVFSRYGINKIIRTPLMTEGNVLFLKSGAPGVIAWEKPLHQEYTREGIRFTDVYSLECRPVYAMFDASAVLMLEGTNS